MKTQPSLFLSHGAPDLALKDGDAHRFLRELGRRLERPEAIVIASAHHEAAGGPLVRAPERFATWHDFGAFDRRLFGLRYEPPGAPALADEVRTLLAGAGFNAGQDPDGRIDHGAWVPLSLLFPEADIPLVMVSTDPAQDSLWHHRIGLALAPLRRRNVLLIGSGSISHNLRAVFSPASGEGRQWVEEFTAWLETKVRDGDRERLLSAMEAAPSAERNHPTDEHLLPFFFALGAGGADAAGARLHHSFTYDVLAMDAYAFGEPALLQRLGETRLAAT
jgi:4,5-DOPA dioxygenase extradiol